MKTKIKPNVCILRTDGTNCDQETAYAFSLAGGQPHLVHINELRKGTKNLRDYQILAIPGGFSYGDDIASGKVLANELISFLGDQLREFVASGKPIIGICNGFQVLVRTGLLPFGKLGEMQVTLDHNDSGHFHCKWYKMRFEKSLCIWTAGLYVYDVENTCDVEYQVAHGEGKFFAEEEVISRMESLNLVALRYSTAIPNGSVNRIAGVCDPTGKIFGLMPHPERFVERRQHPNWRTRIGPPQGLPIFRNGVAYAAEL